MPGPESILWRDHVSLLKNFGKAKRLEDALELGVSDVVYCLRWLNEDPKAGWCELKRRRTWPSRSTTKVRLPHFTIDQVIFLEEWGRAGMGAFLLAQVGTSFLVWRWEQVRAIQAGLPRPTFTASAEVYQDGRFPLAKVLRCLTKI